MRSLIFAGQRHKTLEAKVLALINESPDFMSAATAQSPRAAGDAIESIVARSLGTLLGNAGSDYTNEFARRAMADVAFTDANGCYYVVDVKTHRTDTKFNMPNLTSVERLARFYESDTNFFCILMVSYTISSVTLKATDVTFVPIEFIDWGCLTIGALGWGQIQIANANRITINDGYSRKRWMLEFCDAILSFYPREIEKIGERIARFEGVRDYWRKKAE